MMAEDGGDDDIFVYMGGDQVVPEDVRRVRIDKSVRIIPSDAFNGREHLIYAEFHDGIEEIGNWAFSRCYSLKSVRLLGVKVIKMKAFHKCYGLAELEFGDKLETIEEQAFSVCISLRTLTMPSVTTLGYWAFSNCQKLTDLDLPEGLETIGQRTFDSCVSLRRIAMPLKDDLIEDDAFCNCPDLTTVDLVGGIRNTTASLHLEGWRNEMKGEINRINQALPNTNARGKTPEIREWVRSVIRRIDHYKTEHRSLLKEAATLLELALWKANLDINVGGILEQTVVRTTRRQLKRARKEKCVTSGASIVIKNVLPFLKLE